MGCECSNPQNLNQDQIISEHFLLENVENHSKIKENLFESFQSFREEKTINESPKEQVIVKDIPPSPKSARKPEIQVYFKLKNSRSVGNLQADSSNNDIYNIESRGIRRHN